LTRFPKGGIWGFLEQYRYNIDTGIGAQSTLRGKTFLPENYVWKINKMPKFYVICPKNYQNAGIFNDIYPKNACILHDNCPKNIFPEF